VPARRLAVAAVVVAASSSLLCPIVGHMVAAMMAHAAGVKAKRSGASLGRLPLVAFVVAALGFAAWSTVLVVNDRGTDAPTVGLASASKTTTSGAARATTTERVVPAATSTTASAPASVVRGTAPPAVSGVDADLLARLTIAGMSDPAGYDRDSFGYPQGGTDTRGCDTRALVLIRDSTTPPHVDYPGCKVVAGRWIDAYTGEAHEAPSEVSVDHVVALKEAWRSGASSWDLPRRVAFGNDMEAGALVLVAGSGNASKGDKDPAAWSPSDPVRAKAFARGWLVTKVRWDLTADEAEAGAIRRLLGASASTVPQGVRAPVATTPTTRAAPTTRPTTTTTWSRPPTSPPTTSSGQETNPGGPNGATARCNDGTYSHSAHRSGTCSHHGGVAEWY
jgi:hypothetical protein